MTRIKDKKNENLNKSVSTDLLESYRRALYAIRDFLDRASNDLINISDIEVQLKISMGISNLGKDLGKNIESLDKLEEKVKRDEKAIIAIRGNAEVAKFEE